MSATNAAQPPAKPPANAPAVEKTAYSVKLQAGDQTEQSLIKKIRDASRLAALAPEAAADPAQLLARARADLKLLKAVLYEDGYYAGTISIDIAGRNIETQIADQPSFSHEPVAAEASRAVNAPAIVPVTIRIIPGPVFRLGTIDIQTTTTTTQTPPLEPAAYGLVTGNVARAGIVVSAINKIIDEWHIAGYPFVTVAEKDISADHASARLDVKIVIDPGKPATYGWINVASSGALSPRMVARYSALRPGRSYNPKDLQSAGERLRKLDTIESVRIRRGEELDANGGVPITLDVTERKPRTIGIAAAVSTVDGGEVQAYWAHRNLFGRAERLRVEGGISQIGTSDALADLQYMTRTIFVVPAILDIDTDLVTEFQAAKERPETYESRYVRLKIGLNRIFNEHLSGDVALAGLVSREDDVFGRSRHALASLPANIIHDTRDNKLDPASGWRGTFGAEPAYDVDDGSSFFIATSQLNVYQAIDAAGRIVLASRLGASSIVGSSTASIPASMRLYGGGSGSVRGYAYRSIGPRLNGEVVGGRGLLQGSAELRWRVSDSIGLVAFADAASVSADYIPTLDDIETGAGVGVRYYTSLGPLRFDVAWPLADDVQLADVAIYVGIGQAF